MRRRRGERRDEGKGEGGTAAPGWTCKGQKKRTKIVKSNAENFSLTASDAGDTEEGGGQCKNGRASERGERREREATVKSASSSHLEKQNPFRAPHYLFANEEKGRWAGGQALLLPSILPSVRLSNAPIRKARGPRHGRQRQRKGGGRRNGTREILFRLNRDWNSHLSRAVSAPQRVPLPAAAGRPLPMLSGGARAALSIRIRNLTVEEIADNSLAVAAALIPLRAICVGKKTDLFATLFHPSWSRRRLPRP